MPSKPKTERREHPPETLHGIWALSCIGYGPSKIQKTFPLLIPTIKLILKRLRKNKDDPWQKALRTGRPLKLNKRSEQRLVRHLKRYPFKTYKVLATLGKTTTLISISTVR
jgi:transposase